MTDRIEPEVNVLILTKPEEPEERYVFCYHDDRATDTVRQLGRYASDPELNFTWADAVTLSRKIRDGMPDSP